MKYLCFILLLIIALITVGCLSGNQNTVVTPTQTSTIISSDPIVGIWQYSTADGSKLYTFNFSADWRYSFTDSSDPNILSGTWSKVRENEYLITYTNNQTQDLVYNPEMDTYTMPEFPFMLAYRLGKESVGISSPTLTTPSLHPTHNTQTVTYFIETLSPTPTIYVQPTPVWGTFQPTPYPLVTIPRSVPQPVITHFPFPTSTPIPIIYHTPPRVLTPLPTQTSITPNPTPFHLPINPNPTPLYHPPLVNPVQPTPAIPIPPTLTVPICDIESSQNYNPSPYIQPYLQVQMDNGRWTFSGYAVNTGATGTCIIRVELTDASGVSTTQGMKSLYISGGSDELFNFSVIDYSNTAVRCKLSIEPPFQQLML